MTGPPPPRLQVQLNAGVLLNLLLDQPFGERLQEFDAETASLFGPGLCLAPDGRVADGVEEVMAGPGDLTDLSDRTGQLRLNRDETRLVQQSQMVFDQLSLLARHFACTIFAEYLGDLRRQQIECAPTVLDLQQQVADQIHVTFHGIDLNYRPAERTAIYRCLPRARHGPTGIIGVHARTR